ncbi:hypothetical protein CDAR_507371 [Caerostris darwini]|uniref:Uncharacterized protein n=1 Tax=Caerostris darwini TaxID=1538125 RepID=A0AAV4WCJ4_9ARAC|nr:hypothetical protein CDAR_507371 [Caerostris darwini]
MPEGNYDQMNEDSAKKSTSDVKSSERTNVNPLAQSTDELLESSSYANECYHRMCIGQIIALIFVCMLAFILVQIFNADANYGYTFLGTGVFCIMMTFLTKRGAFVKGFTPHNVTRRSTCENRTVYGTTSISQGMNNMGFESPVQEQPQRVMESSLSFQPTPGCSKNSIC